MKNINIRKWYYHLRHRYFTMNNVVIAVALVIGASWAWGSIGMMQRNYGLQKELDTKSRQEKLAELETQALAYEQKYYQSNEFKEISARQYLGLAAPGEKVLILPPNTAAAKNATTATPEAAPKSQQAPSNIEQWTNFLFGGNHKGLRN
jgi:type II secretory pathway component HofQ